MIVLNIKDNRGYSLVELIVSMAVFALVAGAILLFIYSGSRSYSFAKTELDLQMESQTLLSQINTMILQSDNAVYDSSENTLTLYQMATKNVVSATNGSITMQKEVTGKKVIYFDAGTSSLYLEEYSDDAAPACTPSEERLFSSYIDSFATLVDGNKVTLKLQMKNNKQKFNASVTSKIRNKLITYP